MSRDENITFVSRHSTPFVYVAKQKRGPFPYLLWGKKMSCSDSSARLLGSRRKCLTCSAAVSNDTMRASTKNLNKLNKCFVYDRYTWFFPLFSFFFFFVQLTLADRSIVSCVKLIITFVKRFLFRNWVFVRSMMIYNLK